MIGMSEHDKIQAIVEHDLGGAIKEAHALAAELDVCVSIAQSIERRVRALRR